MRLPVPAGLPQALLDLQDPTLPVLLPPPGQVPPCALGNWELDKLVTALGRNKATWRRTLLLFEWLKTSGHALDDRLCTTVRTCTRARAHTHTYAHACIYAHACTHRGRERAPVGS